MATATFPRTCPFCESCCGLIVEVDVENEEIIRISGDPQHPGSNGFVCPKSQGLRGLRQDSERLRMPLLRVGDEFHEIGWEEALDRAALGLKGVLERHGPSTVGLYTGNPQAHIPPLQMALGGLLSAMPALYTNAGSIDSYPRFFVGAYLYGNIGHVPIPDIDRTDFFLVFGANPLVSNGSMFGAANLPLRLKKLRTRGGKLVVIDPRRTETAKIADQHLAIRPGSDALLALAMIDTMFAEGLVDCGRMAGFVSGLDELRAAAARFDADRVAPLVGVEAAIIRELARDFSAAPTAAAYSRVGANTQTFGSLGVWAIDCLNILTGNLDERGGVIFPVGVLPQFMNDPYVGDQPAHGRWRSRVSGTPELGGTMPTTTLWEEIETPGEGQIRGLLIICGNPVLSNPNAARVSAALDDLEFMVTIDIYLNETTRHADLILPPMDHLKRTDFTMIWNNWMVEDIVAYSPAVFEREPGEMDDWDVLMALGGRISDTTPTDFERKTAEDYLTFRRPALPRFPVAMSVAEALMRASGDSVPEKIYDVLLRTGSAGDGFGVYPGELSLEQLKSAPPAMNFGPMQPGQMPQAIDTPDGKLALAPPILINDLDRLESAIQDGFYDSGHMMLIGRRHLRSNNSWMHNLAKLAKGPPRCTALINPVDAEQLGIQSGEMVRVRSRVGAITVAAEVSDEMGVGVISIPHGFSEELPRSKLSIAHRMGGANVNILHDDAAGDKPSGGAAFNATRVVVERLETDEGLACAMSGSAA
jgi:anaerobic selenocysteine-containing dehydrogenase